MNNLTTWAVLVLTFPTENATARMRAWRALKAKGCAVLRDGIYLLPHTAEREEMLRDLAASIDEAGGTAHLLRAQSRDASQEADFRARFDRNDDYGTFVASLGVARKTLGSQKSPAFCVACARTMTRSGQSTTSRARHPPTPKSPGKTL